MDPDGMSETPAFACIPPADFEEMALAPEVHDNARNRMKRNFRVDRATPQPYSNTAPAELGESPGR